MRNDTRYDGRTILRWIRASFAARNRGGIVRKLRVRVTYTRTRVCNGSTGVGGTYFRLALPRDPSGLTAADLSFTIDYLTLLYLGTRRRDMSMSQKIAGLRKWAEGLPLPALRPEPASEPADKRKTAVERRAKYAKNQYAKYDVLEAACAAELLRLGRLKKKWAAKVDYYTKKGH